MDHTWKISLNVPITVITTVSLSLCCSCSPGYRTFLNICLFFLCYSRCVEAVWEWLIADEWVRRETHTLIVILSPLCVCFCLTCAYEREKVLDCVRLGGSVFVLLILRKSTNTHTYKHTHTLWCIWSPGIIFTHHLPYKNQSGLQPQRDMNLCVCICVGTLYVISQGKRLR